MRCYTFGPGSNGDEGYSIFLKAPDWSLTIRLFNVISRAVVKRSYPSADMLSVCSIAPANRAKGMKRFGILVKIL